MKMIFLLFMCLVLTLVQGCCLPLMNCEDDDFSQESRYDPVYLNRVDFEKSVLLKNTVAIGISGKIYVKDHLLFINEVNKGFHIYDNSDPKNPKPIKFLEAPGSTDLAVRNNMIYINQATDLIAVDYNAATNAINLTKRIPNTFPELVSPDGFYANNVPENNIVIDWKLKR